MDTTGERVNGSQLQGASPGTNGGASGNELQGSNPQANSSASEGINNLQPQGTFTVQDLSNNVLPKAEAGGGLMTPIAIVIVLAIAVAILVMIYKKRMPTPALVEGPAPKKPIDVNAEVPIMAVADSPAEAVKKVIKKKAAAKSAPKKKPTPKKRSSTGRKKR